MSKQAIQLHDAGKNDLFYVKHLGRGKSEVAGVRPPYKHVNEEGWQVYHHAVPTKRADLENFYSGNYSDEEVKGMYRGNKTRTQAIKQLDRRVLRR